MIDLSPRQVRTHLLLAVYLLSLFSGLHNALTAGSGAVHLLLSVLVASTITSWCVADAKVIRRPFLYSWQWIMLMTWPFSAPTYLVWTRRRRGAGLAAFHAVMLLTLFYLTFVAASFLVHGPAIFHPPGK